MLNTRHHSDLTDAEIAEDLIDPYAETPKYALAVVYFMFAGLIVFGIGHVVYQLRQSKRFGKKLAQSTVYRKCVAGLRVLSSTQHRVYNCNFPILGVGLLMLAFTLFILIWSLGVWPYYRSSWHVGSPPLAMRTGFFALGCFPFILAFGAKWNIVSFVTGVSHEKLQIFHQWMSHMFMVLSLLHTFPFVVLGLAEIRPDSGGMTQLEYGWKNKVYYWSGSAALIVLAWLVWGSLWFVRNPHYEIFKLLHIISAALFFALLYIHCNNLLNSWAYLQATLAIYGLSVVARFALIAYRNGRRIPRAQIETLPCDMVCVTIACPPVFSWRPGQHYFLNFISCRPLESHPFTISNTCASESGNDREMVVMVKANNGLTKRLARLAERGTTNSVAVLLDGPYGGVEGSLSIYDRVLLVAGGSGASFTVPILMDIVQRYKEGKGDLVCKHVQFVWAVSKEDSIGWFKDTLDNALAALPDGFLRVLVYITDAGRSPSPEDEKEDVMKAYEVLAGRPQLRATVEDFCKEIGTVGVACCGPDSLTLDVRNSVARCELDIVRGKSVCREIFLHSESYSW